MANLITFPEDFDNAYWTKSFASITPNAAVAPNGTTTADKLVEDSSNNLHGVNKTGLITSGGDGTVAVYAQAAGRSWFRFKFNSLNAFFDLANGVPGTVDTGLINPTITHVGYGIYRCSVSRVALTATGAWELYLASANGTGAYLGDGSSGIYLWGAQAVASLILEDYYPNEETIAWVDSAGVVTTLTDQADVEVEWGVSGRFMPPTSFIEDEVPLQPGARLRRVKVRPREVELPITVMADTQPRLRSRLRALLATFDPSRGDGRLRITAPGGSQRELFCRYAAGLEIAESPDNGPLWQRALVVLRATDPYWYAVTASTVTYSSGTTASFFPFFPLRLTSSEVFSDQTVNNDGDAETWPVWTITGPGTNPTIRNVTTGDLFTVNVVLSAGDQLIINTSPFVKTVTRAGANLFPNLTSTSVLWPLAIGTNQTRVEMSGTGVGSAAAMSYFKRYLGA